MKVGYNKFSAGIGKKQEFIDDVCPHAIIENSYKQIYQFKKDLELGALMELYKKFPEKSFSGAYVCEERCSSGCNQESIKSKSYT